MVLLQTAVTFAFMQHHFELVTRRLSEAVARDVGALADLYRQVPPGADDASWRTSPPTASGWTRPFFPPGRLPPACRGRSSARSIR